ncbi:MAG: hypothetical protein ACE5NG_11335, partial [bacterium]
MTLSPHFYAKGSFEHEKTSPQLAVYEGEIFIIWHLGGSPGGTYCVRSTDGGNSFTNGSYVDKRGPAAMGIDAAGQIYVIVGENVGAPTVGNFYCCKSTDKGETFSPAVRINDESPGYKYFPSAVVEDDGDIFVAWQDHRDNNAFPNIYFSMSDDGGRSFSQDVKVNTMLGECWEPSLDTDGRGTVWVVWQRWSTMLHVTRGSL